MDGYLWNAEQRSKLAFSEHNSVDIAVWGINVLTETLSRVEKKCVEKEESNKEIEKE